MKTSISLTLVFLASILLFSCHSKKIENLESERTRLQADSISKDSILNDWFKTFNDIEDNLSEITSRQKYITSATATENPKDADVRERIRMEIASINDILLENENKLQQLKGQLKSANIKIKSLEETMAILTKRVEEKDVEIAGLKEQLIQLNIEKENLNKTVSELREEAEKQQELLEEKEQTIDQHNVVYYIVGTTRYLKDNEIIESTGLLGSSKQLNAKVETGLFTAADLRNLTSININSEKAALITIHPEGSYEFVREGKVIQTLVITRPEDFWKTSRFCVVETR